MKKTFALLFFISIFMLLTAMQCDDDDIYYNCEDNLLNLAELKSNIEMMADETICDDAFQCRYIAFGSKPCGGPWEYLIYSTSIDTLTLTSLVMEYNQLEANYNLNCGAVSDCSTPIPPIGFECQDNQCIPIFE